MWKLFSKDPTKVKAQKRDALLEAAFKAQRNGNIREYSRLTTEADALTQELDAMAANREARREQ